MRGEQITKFNRGQASKIFKDVAETGHPLVVMQHSHPVVIIIPVHEYCLLKNIPLQIDVPLDDKKKDRNRER